MERAQSDVVSPAARAAFSIAAPLGDRHRQAEHLALSLRIRQLVASHND